LKEVAIKARVGRGPLKKERVEEPSHVLSFAVNLPDEPRPHVSTLPTTRLGQMKGWLRLTLVAKRMCKSWIPSSSLHPAGGCSR